MHRKEIEKIYIKKINELKKHNKTYFSKDNPIISDKDSPIDIRTRAEKFKKISKS